MNLFNKHVNRMFTYWHENQAPLNIYFLNTADSDFGDRINAHLILCLIENYFGNYIVTDSVKC